MVARCVSTASTFSSSCFDTYSVKTFPEVKCAVGQLNSTLRLCGYQGITPVLRLFCSLLKSLCAPSQETGSEAEAAAHTEGGLISLIDLHSRGCTLRARISPRLYADLMSDISPQNQQHPHENCLRQPALC